MIDDIDGKHGGVTKYFEAWKLITYFLNKKLIYILKKYFRKYRRNLEVTIEDNPFISIVFYYQSTDFRKIKYSRVDSIG
jgi:hypothetical protein